jgi:trehalose-6-phosphatase
VIRKIAVILFLSLFFACGTSVDKIPDNVLSKDKMKNVLIDIHMLEGVINVSGLSADTANAKYKVMQAELFAKHGVKQVQFDSSMAYYARHLADMNEIYAGVIDSISVKEALGKID